MCTVELAEAEIALDRVIFWLVAIMKHLYVQVKFLFQ